MRYRFALLPVLLALACCSHEPGSHLASSSSSRTPGTVPGTNTAAASGPGQRLARRGDEIVVCGQLFHTTAPVVLWLDPDGYDAYRVGPRFSPDTQPSWETSLKDGLTTPNRYASRLGHLPPAEQRQLDEHGWSLDLLRQTVDQFVIHYDQVGISRRCFHILQDRRGLSIHFMLDLDGTIYQTLDLKEKAWDATIANDRSIGIEIANVGAYEPGLAESPLPKWYHREPDGSVRIVIPPPPVDAPIANYIRTPGFIARPSRPEPVVGQVQGVTLEQYDLTPQQYDSLIRLTATLCRVFPLIRCDYPRDAAGRLITHQLTEAEFRSFHGILGHYHIQKNKIDPGPAFDWDRLIQGVQALDAADPVSP